MATLAEHPMQATQSPMPTMNAAYDHDLDSFINFDQLAYTSADPARPKVALASQPSVASTDFGSSDARSASFASSGQSPMAFQAPSHHYEEHRQQTGLPPGALSMTYNQVNPMGFGNANQGYGMNGEMFPTHMKREDAPFDFNTAPTRNPSEMDIESDGMNNTPYYVPTNQNKNQFVDPNALGGHELAQAGPSTQVGRMYPGMHQQQAAMAKAAAQQQKQHEMMRQQVQQRRVEESPGATPNRVSRQPDPVVEERISRLLQQMRQNAVANGEASPTPSSVMPHMAKSKKDEADMDEDERLLASEEGKKLSSKERRQLRNKVSARAFRSRRKEYIGQLESEIAARTNEAHDLRMQNRALFEENARLNDLARMLLASPHFSNFLQEMPDSVGSQVQAPQQQAQQAPQPQQPAVPKETSAPRPQEFQMQQNPQVMMVPNQGMDASMMNNGGWNSGIDMNYGNTPVFAVLDVPEGPALDVEVLSGKSYSPIEITESSKNEAPVLDRPESEEPVQQSDIGVANPDVEIDESDPAFALFVDSPAPSASSDVPAFDGVQSEKASQYELVVDPSEVSASAKSRFNQLCATKLASLQARGTLFTAALRAGSRTLPQTAIASIDRAAAFRSVTHPQAPGRPATGLSLLSRARSSKLRKKQPAAPRPAPLRARQQKLEAERQKVKQEKEHIAPDTVVLNTTRASRSELVLARKSLLERAEESSCFWSHPMKFHWQVLTTPTADTPGTFLSLHFPEKRYIFGQLSEGTQRACVQRGTRLSSHLNQIFITGRTEWANNGGLIGVILTIADATAATTNALEEAARKKQQIAAQRSATEGPSYKPSPTPMAPVEALKKNARVSIHGGTNIMHTMATARRFVFRKGLPIYMNEYSAESIAKGLPASAEDPFQEPTWHDENIKVWVVPIKPTASRVPSPSRSQSPRKRSLDEFQETVDPGAQKTHDDLLRQSIVQDMFNSTWKMDALHETPLADVKMPATLFVRNPETKDLEIYKGPIPGDGQPLPDITVLVRKPWPGATVETLPTTTPSKESLCYIVRNYDVRGKFDVNKARSLGITTGAEFSALTSGRSVTNPDGQEVTPDMVIGPPRLGQGVAIMEVPSPEYVEDMVNRPEWNSPAVTGQLKVFFWILGPGVGEHPKFREFVARMSESRHLVSGTDYCPNYLALESSAQASIRLNRLKGDNYSIPVHDNETLPQRGVAGSPEAGAIDFQNLPFETMKPGLIVQMEPTFQVDTNEITKPVNTAMTVRIPASVTQRLDTIAKRTKKPEFQKKLADFRDGLPGADAEVIALGTGSSAPSKYRNVSATLLHAPGYGYYLLDCGENTLGQLKRVFEPEQLREVLQNLRMIWISHLHADHHLGTVSVIRAWYHEVYGPNATPAAQPETDLAKILQEKRLAVVSDEMMITWLEEYSSVENFGFDKVLPLSAHPEAVENTIITRFSYRQKQDGGPPFGPFGPDKISLSFLQDSDPLTPLLKQATGLSDLLTTKVKHCRGALALSLVFPDGFKVSYSGDCRPSDKFASIGAGSTLLIHEATFSNDMLGSAIAKRHSTASEALEVAKRMNARSVFLTHFSQRYQKIAQLDQNPVAYNKSRSQNAGEDAGPGADADIPLDEEPEPEPAEQAATQTAHSLLDDINFPTQDRPSLSADGSRIPLKNVPVAAAMDYMHIKVGDLIYAQAYAPALEKMVEVMEQSTASEAERQKKHRQKEEEERKAAKMKKHSKERAAEALATAAALAASLAADAEKQSVWSADESEDGWVTSDPE
ncbi:hypothetical protein N7532_006983 [Penicillium argentinense]|uniref:ribonuclease Z n=1 Tax=Penicillium argentinense TaxID=1131581 RepID=A0A9W9FHA6_9EURO|nr:uncharacterized protein N7532_006983 [Penicillium argentinense]KAJ5099982.1 hypothetical protein N7532_006983 [Penicillium argentinense]